MPLLRYLSLLARLLFLAGALIPPVVFAQTALSFEADSVPSNWTSQTPGHLSISEHRYKLGVRSLRWDWQAGGVITIAPPGIDGAKVRHPTLSTTCSFWVWNGVARPEGKLQIEFMTGDKVQYSFEFGLNFTGWRRAVRSFQDDMEKVEDASSDFDSVRIIAPESGSGSFFIDAVEFAGEKFDRVRDAQNEGIKGAGSWTYFAHAFSKLPKTSPPSASAQELVELQTLRERWLARYHSNGAPSSAQLSAANAKFTALGIVDLEHDSTRGKVIAHATPDNLNSRLDLSEFDAWTLHLARHYRWSVSADETGVTNPSGIRMNQLVRHLLDQGLAANSNLVPTVSPIPSYDFRELPEALIMLAADTRPASLRLPNNMPRRGSAFNAATKAKIWELLCWAYGTGDAWHTEWERNMDDIYLHSTLQLGAILFVTPNDDEAVRQLKAHQTYMNRFWSPAPGGEGGVKVDGTGFHHNSHYMHYMYSFRKIEEVVSMLRGTGFQLSQPAYETLRDALLAMVTMSADREASSDIIGYHSNALAGRFPHSNDLEFNKDELRDLALAGGPFYHTPFDEKSADPILAGVYKRRFGGQDSQEESEEPEDFSDYAPITLDGFYQYNYSPLGVYRRNTWVASMRAPNRYFWSAEIWTSSNVYGRYQGYGALEILYNGEVISRAPKDANGNNLPKVVTVRSGQSADGWDWSQPPGTTTIALPHDKLGMKEREDVRSQLNFSGALAFQSDLNGGQSQSGLYAANFQESRQSTLVGLNHNPTFVWRKSWFCFGSQIVCLGSDISNQNTPDNAAYPTVTTLFQGVLTTRTTPTTLDNSPIRTFPYAPTAVSGPGAHWLLDAYGTGFLVQPQAGNTIKISRTNQKSAHHTGSGAITTDDYAKAWIDHGTSPTGAGYEYAVFPATTAADMQAAATAHADPATKPYTVLQRDSRAHAVKWNATGQIGYALFTAGTLSPSLQSAGLLLSVQRPCLVMTQLDSAGNARVTLVDPDLNFADLEADYGTPDHGISRIHYGKTDSSRPRTLDFTVSGTWVTESTSAATVVAYEAGRTTLRITTQDGLANHLVLIPSTYVAPSTASWANQGNSWESAASWTGTPPPNAPYTVTAALGAATVQPVLNSAFAVNGLTLGGGTTLSGSGALTLGTGGVVATGASNTVSLTRVKLHTPQTWTVGTGNLRITSAIEDGPSAALTKSGSGTLALAGLTNFTSALNVQAGVVNVADGGVFRTSSGIAFADGGTGQFTFSGLGRLELTANVPELFSGAASGSVRLGLGSTINTAGYNTRISRPLAGLSGTAGGLTKVGLGTLTLSEANTYTGATRIEGGVLSTGLLASQGNPSGIGAAGSSASNLVIDGGTLRYTGPTLPGFGFWTRALTIGAQGGAFDLSAATGELRINGGIALSGTGPRTLTIRTGTPGGRLNSVLGDGSGGATSLVKTGVGTLELTGANTYTGQLHILSGSVQYGNGELGGESTGVGHSVRINSGAILRFRHAGTNVVTYDAPISGRGAVFMNYNNSSGGGSLTLGGNNSFSGGLTIDPSSASNVLTLRAGSPSALGTGDVIIGPHGALDLNGFANTIGLLASAEISGDVINNGRVTNNGATDATLTLAGSGEKTFGGGIQDGARKVSLLKTGPGTQILAGNNTYTGDTVVNQGRLVLAGTGRLAFRPVRNGDSTRITIAAGASATFEGSFVIHPTDADLTSGNRWQLVRADGSATFASSFRVTDFTSAGAAGSRVWTRIDGARTWTFTEATGELHLKNAVFASWLAAYPTLTDTTPGGDPDGDGVSNLLEFALGGDPTQPSDAALLPEDELWPVQIAVAATPHLTFSFYRSDVSEQEVVLTFQHTNNLLGTEPWTDLVIGKTSGSASANGVAYTVEENADAPDRIIVTVPFPAESRSVFGRLRATLNP